ncbi:MAG: DUF6378 domain-containing protein [Pirellulales bacterium]
MPHNHVTDDYEAGYEPDGCCSGSGMPCPAPRSTSIERLRKVAGVDVGKTINIVSSDVVEDETVALLATRATDYGPPEINMTGIGLIWTAQLRNHYGIADLPILGPEMVALMMAGLKLNRLAKSPKHGDSYADARGYLKIAEDV